jgi:hypothetical protein
MGVPAFRDCGAGARYCNTCSLFSGPTDFTGAALDTGRGFCAESVWGSGHSE